MRQSTYISIASKNLLPRPAASNGGQYLERDLKNEHLDKLIEAFGVLNENQQLIQSLAALKKHQDHIDQAAHVFESHSEANDVIVKVLTQELRKYQEEVFSVIRGVDAESDKLMKKIHADMLPHPALR